MIILLLKFPDLHYSSMYQDNNGIGIITVLQLCCTGVLCIHVVVQSCETFQELQLARATCRCAASHIRERYGR